jgi:hypothetical protein
MINNLPSDTREGKPSSLEVRLVNRPEFHPETMTGLNRTDHHSMHALRLTITILTMVRADLSDPGGRGERGEFIHGFTVSGLFGSGQEFCAEDLDARGGLDPDADLAAAPTEDDDLNVITHDDPFVNLSA